MSEVKYSWDQISQAYFKGIERGRSFAALEAEESGKQATNIASTPCKCVVKQTEVPGMGIIYAQAECPIHGHLHGAHCLDVVRKWAIK